MLTRLAHVIVRYRWSVIGTWIGLTLFGVFSAIQVEERRAGQPERCRRLRRAGCVAAGRRGRGCAGPQAP